MLSVDSYADFAADYAAANQLNPAGERWDRAPNDANPLDGQCPLRTGPATWVPITDENGAPLPGVTDAFSY